MTVLRNDARRLAAPGGDPCWLVGLDTAFQGRADPDAALARVPAGSCRIVLLHEPDGADALARRGVRADLLLAGHTHGGQVALPGLGPILLPPLGRRYVRGCHATPAGPLYVSRGLGALPPFTRLGAPPEVVFLRCVGVCYPQRSCVMDGGESEERQLGGVPAMRLNRGEEGRR
ncbi:MAG TPA: hypothetical protein VIL85_10395 [Thermomicrobiales bacterium]